ncbi:unnamed protein product [Bemisia tabaci]|uniref:AAA-ATPase-like domain-containing protein n=1 Tax=Bemisia tabaci TaxID=7038 RepID=A0A9P0A6F4_BEMTA|nr:unnamed protein product [Bemisia tabaci]
MFPRVVIFVLAATKCLALETIKVTYETYDVLRNTELFVDKSLLTEAFLEDVYSPNTLQTGRRSFGKTTNLDMIRRFLGIDVRPNGTMINDKRRHRNYKVFGHTIRSTGEYPLVYKNSIQFFTKNFGEHPVIWLDLAAENTGPYEEIKYTRHLMNGTLREAFKSHFYLSNSSKISSEDKELVAKFLDSKSDLGSHSFSEGISFLKKILLAHYERDAFVLADNVDAALRQIIFDPKRYDDQVIEKLGGFFDSLFDVCSKPEKPGNTLRKRQTLLTSIIPLDTKNPRLFSKNQFPAYFNGFTEPEVRKLSIIRNMEEHMDGITAWYGGFGENSTYNPYSVLSFLFSASKELKPYWLELGSLETFKAAFSPDCFGPVLIEAFERGEFPLSKAHERGDFPLEHVARLKHLQNLRSPPSAFNQCSDDILDTFIAFLVDLGYLTFKGFVCGSVPVFKIPNLEVRGYMSKIFYEALADQIPLNADSRYRQELFDAMTALNGSEATMERFARVLVTLLVSAEQNSGAAESALAHSVRVNLLNPPSKFRVPYVRTSRDLSFDETNQPNLNLVFAVQEGDRTIAFVIKIVSAQKVAVGGEILIPADFKAFKSKGLTRKTCKEIIYVAAILSCDEIKCKFNYFWDDTSLEHEKHVKISKDPIRKTLKTIKKFN